MSSIRKTSGRPSPPLNLSAMAMAAGVTATLAVAAAEAAEVTTTMAVEAAEAAATPGEAASESGSAAAAAVAAAVVAIGVGRTAYESGVGTRPRNVLAFENAISGICSRISVSQKCSGLS